MTRRKKVSVHKALKDNKWIMHIMPLQTTQEIQEYVTLWEQISDIQLTENGEDTIRWRWINGGLIYNPECISLPI
jgi:hypothetical protein